MSKVLNEPDISRLLERGTPLLTKLLKQCLLRPLACEPYVLQEVPQYPEPPPPNLTREEFAAKGPFYRFVADGTILSIITTIELWLAKAIANNEPWISRVNASGRVVRLRKIKTLDDILDLYFKDEETQRKRQATAADLETGNAAENVTPVMRLPNGLAAVRLLTPASLAWEGRWMGHCLGNKTYATCMARGYAEYYSMRDDNGCPHVTMEVANERLHQSKGRANSNPYPRYLQQIEALAAFMGWELCDPYAPLPQSLRYAEHCRTQDIDIQGDFSLADHFLPMRLPRTMQIRGNFIIRDCPSLTALPEVMDVGEDLIVQNCVNLRVMPLLLRVGRNADFSGCVGMRRMPMNFHAGGSVDLTGCASLSMDGSLAIIGRGLDITGCHNITRIPRDVRVGASIRYGRTTFSGKGALNRSLGRQG